MDEMEQAVSQVKSRRAACYNEIDAIQQDLRKASVRENTAKMNVETDPGQTAGGKAEMRCLPDRTGVSCQRT